MPPDLPEGIRGDEKRLRQVLLNLLANAVKFTDRGRVVLRVSRIAPSRLCFTIKDTGIGIEAAELETIFQHFEQSGNRQHRSGGAGLGLAISRQLVRLMGGDIEVESRISEGSMFRFELELPTVEVMSSSLLSVHVAAEHAKPRRKILIVGNAAENRTVLANLLVQQGFDTLEARDGYEALDLALSTSPDLILIEYDLSGGGSQEIVARLRQWSARTPIVVLSAGSYANSEEECVKAGANAVISGLFERDNLLTQIAALLDTAQTLIQPPTNPAMTYDNIEVLIFPPTEEMQILHRLAQLGSMRDILHYAERIAGIDPSYCVFAARLRRLAEGYQSKAILVFVEQHLNDIAAYEASN